MRYVTTPAGFVQAATPAMGIQIHRRWAPNRHRPYRAIVVIPACNEAELIGRCLHALEAQSVANEMALAALVLVNGTTDATYDEALRVAKTSGSIDVHVIEATLPHTQRHAGTARQRAVQLACELPTQADAILFMTDADSVVPRNWVQHYGELIWQLRYDAVAGGVDIMSEAQTTLPHALTQRIRWETAYESRLDALEAWLDPSPHNPWPRHYQASGANIAIRRELCRSLLRSEWPACGEDKALIAAVEALDGCVRHDTQLRVATSGRLFGRARGGMADTIRHRIIDPQLPCDPRLEAVERAGFRARTRCIWRGLYTQASNEQALRCLARSLEVSVDTLRQACRMPRFGGSWQWLEAHSPRLQRHALTPAELSEQVAQAELLLDRLGVPASQRPIQAAPPQQVVRLQEAETAPALQVGA